MVTKVILQKTAILIHVEQTKITQELKLLTIKTTITIKEAAITTTKEEIKTTVKEEIIIL